MTSEFSCDGRQNALHDKQFLENIFIRNYYVHKCRMRNCIITQCNKKIMLEISSGDLIWCLPYPRSIILKEYHSPFVSYSSKCYFYHFSLLGPIFSFITWAMIFVSNYDFWTWETSCLNKITTRSFDQILCCIVLCSAECVLQEIF